MADDHMNWEDEALPAIAAITGHGFRSPKLLRTALTHPSVASSSHYQRLEFLGDRVLGLVVARWLYDRFPNEQEGKLNRRFIALVRQETLADITADTGISAFILLETGAEQEGTRNTPAVLADICEAVIGALYLDGGLEAAEHFIRTHWAGPLQAGPEVYRDAKTALQEWAQGKGYPLPRYWTVNRTGPDHSPEFEIAVRVDGAGEASAHGASKRSAEQGAAEKLLQNLNLEGKND